MHGMLLCHFAVITLALEGINEYDEQRIQLRIA